MSAHGQRGQRFQSKYTFSSPFLQTNYLAGIDSDVWPDGRFEVLELSIQVETLPATPTPSPALARSAPPASPWVYRPWLDLLVGCGAWSAPLLGLAMWMSPTHAHGWAVAFYLLAIVFNYPHFMATIYRAYHTRADFEKYKFVTLHVTLLVVLTGIVLHASPRLFPWVFTLYICWSPWHYSGQNYGLLMMFVRRSGVEITGSEKRWLRGAFVASYLMLLASFETGGSSDPLILSLGLPAKFTLPMRLTLGGAFLVLTLLGFQRLIREKGARALVAPLTLAFTQFLWFVLPTLLELNSASQVPQTRYSSGILAVLHSAQYIWITSYYQRREARAAGQQSWHMALYFATLIAGGIALFIPGPWLVSYLFHYDFTTSFLIFMALVNIHHFILDGALWKLRDSRVSSLLVDLGGGKASTAAATAVSLSAPSRAASLRQSWGRLIFSAPAVRISLAGLLFLWGGFDQFHFSLRTDDGNLSALLRAAKINPYDSALQARIAGAEAQSGKRDEAVAALRRAIEINPNSIALQQACARAMIEDGRYADAYAHYRKMLEQFPRDADALVNYGLLAARLGRPDQAMDAWEKSVDVDPNQPNVHLYLAEAFDQRGEFAAASRHWNAFLHLANTPALATAQDPALGRQQVTSATVQLADDEARTNQAPAALADYDAAIARAEKDKDMKLEALALAHRADLQDKSGDSAAAAQSYQRALSADAISGDSRSEAFDWFNYGQFLRQHKQPDELAYACFVRAENLLASVRGTDLETVQTAQRQLAGHLGNKAGSVQKHLPGFLERAAGLTLASH